MRPADCYAPTAMAQQGSDHQEFRTGDPWHAFCYLVAGVGFYGLLGWLADLWLGTSFLVAVGVTLGAALGVFMTWSRFRTEPAAQERVAPENLKTQELQ